MTFFFFVVFTSIVAGSGILSLRTYCAGTYTYSLKSSKRSRTSSNEIEFESEVPQLVGTWVWLGTTNVVSLSYRYVSDFYFNSFSATPQCHVLVYTNCNAYAVVGRVVVIRIDGRSRDAINTFLPVYIVSSMSGQYYTAEVYSIIAVYYGGSVDIFSNLIVLNVSQLAKH